jgi:hypothetical protein
MTVAFPDGTSQEAPAPAPAAGESAPETAGGVFTLKADDLTEFAKGAKKDGDSEKAGTDDYFTLQYSVKSGVNTGFNKTWEDDYFSAQRINLGGSASASLNSIKFTTTTENAALKVWWGSNAKPLVLLDANGTPTTIAEAGTKDALYITSYTIENAGTYFLGSSGGTDYIAKVEVTEVVEIPEKTYVLAGTHLDAYAAGSKKDGDSVVTGTDNYFTVLNSAKTKVEDKEKTFADDYKGTRRINFGGGAKATMNSVKFTTSVDGARVTIWWAAGANDRQMAILNSDGTKIAATEETSVKDAAYISTITLEHAGTYFLGGDGNNNYIFKIAVTEGGSTEVVRADWDTVAAPQITGVALNENDPNKIVVKVNAAVGKNGGDKLEVDFIEHENTVLLETKSSIAEKNEFEFEFAPSASGSYHFCAALLRDDEEAKKTSNEMQISFVLPLTVPQIKNLVNKGEGEVAFKFYSVAEAESYQITVTDKADQNSVITRTFTPDAVVDNTKTEYEQRFTDLTVGHTYEFRVAAVRGENSSNASSSEILVTEDGEIEWTFSAFGTGVDNNSKNTGYKKNAEDSVTVWNLGNKGKLVPASTDGLAFYYATIPANMNFTLTATATIDTWTFTNGQEGFGLMACDRVGVNGDATAFWNNSYMASGTKVEYYYDTINHQVTDDIGAAKITMKLGLGVQEKKGVTKENLALLEANDTATINADFVTKMYPLESSCGTNGVGTYNLFGNASAEVAGTVANPVTQVILQIQKNNTGYFVSVLDVNGNVLSQKKFYDTEALEKLDNKQVYAGFFASRTFKATFSNIELTLVSPEEDAPAEGRPVTYVTPNYSITSAEHSNTADYSLRYVGNADGVLTIADAQGNVLVDGEAVAAGEVKQVDTLLNSGSNTFEVTFTPNQDFHPEGDAYQLLSSYETASFNHTVLYKTISDAEEIFVSPSGSANGAGTEEDPVDIYTAVKFVQPGQTIRLAGGTYSLQSTVTVARGIDGTAEQPIRMIADPENRAVFDFNKKCAGFVLAGNYWYISGIDCTRSGNSLKGIQLSGSHCTLEDIHTYENGNTGIQVSRYLSSDSRSEWPSYDLILNCTSFSNADAGYEDADGFAAKLTVGDGIVFDGCIAYNNADDGWDLFAKVETGNIGQVTIRNCVAFANGYGVDGTNEGNGNGFKMGGSSITGRHILMNSAAWDNKAKGIDSNSCPDIQVYHSTSFNNGSNNVALYTNDTANTDFLVEGVMSFRTEGTGVNENLKKKGTQENAKIYGTRNFFWNDGNCANSDGMQVSADWFVSLDAPYATVADPLAVAESMRTADGRIDLGDFLKLSDTGLAALEAAGLEPADVLAILDGNYDVPLTEDPQNEEPKTEDPQNEEPQVEEPQTEEPQVEEPKTEEPKVEEPKTEEPKVEEPKTEEPKVEEPKTEEPQIEEPKTEEPQVEEPKTEEPQVEEPKTEEPQAEEPKTEEPKTEEPAAEQPVAENPQSSESSNAQSSQSSTQSSVTAQTSTTDQTSTTAPAVEPAVTEEPQEEIEATRPTRVVTAPETGVDTVTEEVQIPDEVLPSEDEEPETHTLEESQVAGAGQPSGEQVDQGTAPAEEAAIAPETAPEEEKSFPVAPVAAASAATVVVAAGAAVAVKTGLMAKILSALHLVK